MAFEIRTLPDNWKIVKVEHCGEVITGTTPKTERADYYGGDVPFISPMDINGHRFIRKTRTTLTDNGAKEARILPSGSVLVTCIGILGKVGQIDCEATTNQQINSIIPAVRVIMPSYCFWAAHLLKRQLDILAGLQVVPIVNKRVFSNLLMPVPPLPEQRRIAEILDTIDEAIQKTETLISKLKAMKQGLLHDLLTRGLDKNGKLRDPKDHPEQFKDSPLGRIPRKWKVNRLGQTCELLNGLAFKPSDWSSTGIPIIRIQNLNQGTEFNYFNGIVPDKYIIPPGTLLFSWSGNRGTSFGPFIWSGPTGVLNQHIFKVIPREGIYLHWFCYSLDDVRQRVERAAHGGSGLVHIKRSDLTSYLVATPDEKEQKRIEETISSHDARIRTEEQYRDKLKLQKKGLMHDLLTGKVRIRV